MSTIFPLSASAGQEFQGYRYNGEKWELIGIDLTADYLEESIASSLYLTKASASTTYITQASASITYATKEELENIDLSSASAAVVAAIVDSAPATLDTLNELAAALNDDENFAGTVTTALSNKLNIDTASATYLTQVSASTQYSPIISPTFSGSVSLPSTTTIGGSSVSPVIYPYTGYSGAQNAVYVGPPQSSFPYEISPTDLSFNMIGTQTTDSRISTVILAAITYPGDTKYVSPFGSLSSAANNAQTILLSVRSVNVVEIDFMVRANADEKNSIPAGAKSWKWIGTILVDDNNSSPINSVATLVGSTTSNVHATTTPDMSGFTFNVAIGSAVLINVGQQEYVVPLHISVTHPSGAASPGAGQWFASTRVSATEYA